MLLPTPADVAAATADPLPRWAARSLLPGRGGAAWAHRDAVAVWAPDLFRFDRLVLAGPPEDVLVLLREHAHPGCRPLVTAEVAEGLDWPRRGSFGWMERSGALAADGGRWLGEDEWDEVEALLRKANPDSWAWPREPGPTRWAGIRAGDGTLVSVAADAWSAPDVGFIAGVATHPDHRGRSLSTRVCAFVASALLAAHGTCGLMVDGDNAVAIGLYRKLGFHYRAVIALDA
ncbi:GNAT family N-acetyltransferase [Saccharothrix syringae]|uniref:GNAT family N-acetyltransferase n=1 Tax=Saccharothrix syringae TaxID=103733 RepID=A0A5Q0GR49_SACSY|nr:GNAT family N-acetyltransferase [Saccharothrix syringae]QFZ16537.1 GNAT family N-acetyltransferase [Saccharothrix syringae]